MKKSFFLVAIIAIAFSFTMSSCTKEQTAINQLHGTWKLTSQLDYSGVPVVLDPTCTYESLISFLLCTDKDQGDCAFTTKYTRNCTGYTTPYINAGGGSYQVFENKQLIMGGTQYEIESISKKDLKIHPTESPKATETYSKQ